MLERIATIGTAILFLVFLLGGLLIGTIDIIGLLITGSSVTGIPSEYPLVGVIVTPPVALILIYLGQGLDILFNTKE